MSGKGSFDAHASGHPLDLANVAGLDPAGNDVDGLVPFLGRLGKVGDHALDDVGKTGHVRADVAGSVGVDHAFAGGDLALVAGLGHDLRDALPIVSQSRSMDGDDVGVVDGEDRGMACSRLAWPPKTEQPSVKELVAAITGSLHAA